MRNRSFGTALATTLTAPLVAGAVHAQSFAPPPTSEELARPVSEVANIVVTPDRPRVVMGEGLRLSALAVDRDGKPVPDAIIRYAGGGFMGEMKSDGSVIAGAPGYLDATVSAIVPGKKPFIKRVRIYVEPGPAAAVELDPVPSRLVLGQKLAIHAAGFAA